MSLFILDKEIVFPPLETADADGLLAVGGDLCEARLLCAYRHGIFPWYNSDEPILWWSPDPRFVLFPEELKISGSMKTVLNKGTFKFTVNRAFAEVIANCGTSKRNGEPGTWISEEIISAYVNLYNKGYAISAEAWCDGELAGGLYGVLLGKIFFGESMFSNQSNASKFAFIRLVQHLKKQGVQLIDCQVYTKHLESFGAKMIGRENFMRILKAMI